MKPRTGKLVRHIVSVAMGVLLVAAGWMWSPYDSLTTTIVDGAKTGFSALQMAHDHRELSSGTSLFGSMESIKGDTLMVSLLIIVGGVLILESLFHGLHHFTLDTAFNDVVIAIEKELMVVGCTAFIFKIVINATTSLSHDFFFALEFADLLVPLFSFTNCFLSLILIFMSLRQCDLWRKSFHLKLEELLDEFIQEDGNYTLMKWLAPFTQVVSEMEFRVYHDIFCEAYHIQRKAFAFDEYVSLVYEKFALDIIEIGLVHWVVFLVMMLMSLSKVGRGSMIMDCSEHDLQCEDDRGILIFTILGAAMFVFFLLFALVSRRYEVGVIASRGLESIEDYPVFLLQMEKTAQQSKVENKRLSEEELKKAVKDAMMSSHGHGHGHGHGHHQPWLPWATLPTHVLTASVSAKIRPHGHDDVTEDMLKAAIATSLKRGSMLHKDPSPQPRSQAIMEEESMLSFASPEPSPSRSAAVAPYPDELTSASQEQSPNQPSAMVAPAPYAGSDPAEEQQKEDSPPRPASSRPKPAPVASTGARLHPHPETEEHASAHPEPLLVPSASGDVDTVAREAFNHIVHDEAVTHDLHVRPKLVSRISSLSSSIFHHKHTGSLRDVFWLGNSHMYFQGVKFLSLPLALYLALWFVQFCAASASGVNKFLALLPAVLCIGCLLYTVKCAAILKAIYHVDNDAVLEVLEQTEGSRVLGETIREKLLSKLDLMADPYSELRELFHSIDHDRSNRLSRSEFEFLMNRLDINFSKRKWKQIYHEIDRNYDDEVTFEEFFFFLFPTHDVSVALEKKRLKIIRHRVAAKQRRSKHSQEQRKNHYALAEAEAEAAQPPV